jgi:hypothetical protein
VRGKDEAAVEAALASVRGLLASLKSDRAPV